jgi:pseudouridine-5'-phosphate glycosidase
LAREELERLADYNTTKAVKTSRRDMAYVLSKKLNGGTTVAGTLICAEMCGIKLFATGGIGGVHRNGENTMDISADLVEMGKSSVTIVSSGIKSILDIPRTMEFLETHGVCVASYKCDDKEFPAFYSRESGVKAQYNFNDALEAAMCINKSIQMGLNSSILIGVPVPYEFAMNGIEYCAHAHHLIYEFIYLFLYSFLSLLFVGLTINNAIEIALKEADKAGICGKETTPYLLSAISNTTKGKSLQTSKFFFHYKIYLFFFFASQQSYHFFSHFVLQRHGVNQRKCKSCSTNSCGTREITK